MRNARKMEPQSSIRGHQLLAFTALKDTQV